MPPEYADDNLKDLIMFFVINTPCTDLSSSSVKKFAIGKMKKAPRWLANSSLCVIIHNMRYLKEANEDEITLSNGS